LQDEPERRRRRKRRRCGATGGERQTEHNEKDKC